MQIQTGKNRILFIDVARFLAMALVFYGHFVERIMYLGNPTAAANYKFIYSFHMVLFIVIAGYVSREKDLDQPFAAFLTHRLKTRLVPFAFFTIVFMGLAAVFPGDFIFLKLPSVKGYVDGFVNTLFGLPLFCVPSWFILLVFSVEILHYWAGRFLRSDTAILWGMIFFYLVGYILNWRFDIVNPIKGRVIGWNYLFIHEAILMLGFYFAGILLRRRQILEKTLSLKRMPMVAAAGFILVFATYRLNSGLFSFPVLDAVVILTSSHGHIFWFPFTAAAGCLMILSLARILPAERTITWMGQNTLILMCLNGIFYHYINPPAARWVVDTLPASPIIIVLVSTAVTLASLLFCIPWILLLNRWVPGLVGKPQLRRASGSHP